jgi:hypothetical protein
VLVNDLTFFFHDWNGNPLDKKKVAVAMLVNAFGMPLYPDVEPGTLMMGKFIDLIKKKSLEQIITHYGFKTENDVRAAFFKARMPSVLYFLLTPIGMCSSNAL